MMKNKNSKWIFLGIGVIVGVLLLGFLISRISSTAELTKKDSNKVTVEDREKGSTITFHRDGLVEYKDKTSEYSTIWTSEKMSAFFEYLTSGNFALGDDFLITLPDGTVVSGGSDDELIDEVVDDVTDDEDDDDDDPGSIGELFTTPSPSGGGGSTGGSTGPTPNSGGGGIPSWCKHWRLSYCADNLFDDPTPTPLSNQGVIQAKDCTEWKSQSSNKTVISGDSCAQYFPTPTPE